MNREMKRMMKRQGQVEADGSPARVTPDTARRPAPRPPSQRTSVREFFGEVRDEMKRVNWPSRQETINYSTMVFVVLVVLGAIIFGLNFGLERSVNFLLRP